MNLKASTHFLKKGNQSVISDFHEWHRFEELSESGFAGFQGFTGFEELSECTSHLGEYAANRRFSRMKRILSSCSLKVFDTNKLLLFIGFTIIDPSQRNTPVGNC